MSHPLQCTESTPSADSKDSKLAEPSGHGNAPWLLKRTSITVETTSWRDDSSSTYSGTRADEKGAIRNLIKTRFGGNKEYEALDDGKSVEPSPYDSVQFGTVVSIEASHPLQQRHEMKGLEQAASMKRWTGDGRPAEAWGKLIKVNSISEHKMLGIERSYIQDPELWDPTGDTLIYFGYQRSQASFRVKSSVLEDTKSDYLHSKIQQGQRTPKMSSSRISTNTSSLRGFKSLAIGNGSTRSLSTFPETGTSANETSIRHEIYLPPPEDASKMMILRHHITTRNFLALLLNKPLVGLTFYQALVDLETRLKLYMPKGTDCTRLLIKYLIRNQLHNVSNDPAAAAGLLAWSEDPEVHWQEGWREGFVHCCGMYANLRSLPELRDVTIPSSALLERSVLELQIRIQEAEERLARFNFDDMWPEYTGQSRAGRANYHHCGQFFCHFYEKQYKRWPPKKTQHSNGGWLTRGIVSHLQRDFGALYEFHVDRNITWDERMESRDRHRNVVRKTKDTNMETTIDDQCLAAMFCFFDRKHRYPHIPHPYPLLPTPTPTNDKSGPKEALFGSRSKALEKRINQAYSDSCNARILPTDIIRNPLVEAFARFERTDMLGDADLRDARQGRWILLYGILQILASISADTPNLFFKNDASYFLNPRLKGMPPWRAEDDEELEEASPKTSYCWKVARTEWKKDAK